LTPRDSALDRLLARYWDDTLTPPEWDVLNARLETDAAARRWFREVCVQAVAAGEAAAPVVANHAAIPSEPPARRRISRRLALGFGLGSVAGLTAGAVLTRKWLTSPMAGARVVWTRGQVMRSGRKPEPLAVGEVVPSGTGLSTGGQTSSAMLELADGSTLCLSSDTLVAVTAGGTRVVVQQGGATADLRPSTDDRPVVSVATPLIGLSTQDGADIDLTSCGSETELTVQRGQVAATAREGGVKDVRDGELLTVAYRGPPAVRPTPVLPDTFTLDFRERLPEGWRVGQREETPAGPVLVPELWYDPYHSAHLYQIRSHHQWTRGLVRLFPDSVVRVRYRADRPADGQVVFVVRRPRTAFKDSGCLEWNGRFEACGPDEWKTLTVRASDMLGCKEAPAFAPPWVAFLLIVNTYTEDVGLRVAELRVTRPAAA
jgi:ferric-dicitrate binding protein FerR (iron transport regulator)